MVISRKLVGCLGPEARIDLQSKVDVGSVFSFRIYRNLVRDTSHSARLDSEITLSVSKGDSPRAGFATNAKISISQTDFGDPKEQIHTMTSIENRPFSVSHFSQSQHNINRNSPASTGKDASYSMCELNKYPGDEKQEEGDAHMQ